MFILLAHAKMAFYTALASSRGLVSVHEINVNNPNKVDWVIKIAFACVFVIKPVQNPWFSSTAQMLGLGKVG